MDNYNLYCDTAENKYRAIEIIRASGATLTGVSGCGPGYYIQIDATPAQAEKINARLGATY